MEGTQLKKRLRRNELSSTGSAAQVDDSANAAEMEATAVQRVGGGRYVKGRQGDRARCGCGGRAGGERLTCVVRDSFGEDHHILQDGRTTSEPVAQGR